MRRVAAVAEEVARVAGNDGGAVHGCAGRVQAALVVAVAPMARHLDRKARCGHPGRKAEGRTSAFEPI
jgi:hypothetical protein